MSTAIPSRIDDPSDWRGPDLAATDAYVLTPSRAQLNELEATCAALERLGLQHDATGPEHFALPLLTPLLAQVRHELAHGRGLALLRGLPFADWSKERSRLAAWGLGWHLGAHVVQTVQGQRLVDVTDTTGTDNSPRQFKTSQELRLHSDPCSDMIGLACLQGAKSGGESVVTSAVAVHNAMLETRPDLLQLLYDGFLWHRYGEGRPEDGDITREPVPVFAVRDGQLSCRYVRAPIAAGHRDAGVPLSDAQIAALDEFDRLASSPELRLAFTLQPGDLLMVNNLTVLHARTQFVDHDEPERRRHLLRLWLEGGQGFRAVPPVLNYFNGGACGIMPQLGRKAEYDVQSLYSDRASGGVARLGV